jgi:hypothetical protein
LFQEELDFQQKKAEREGKHDRAKGVEHAESLADTRGGPAAQSAV